MLCPIAPVQASKPLWPVVWGSEVTGLSALTHRIGAESASCAREMWPAVRYGCHQIRFWSSDFQVHGKPFESAPTILT